jgi:peptidoglycan biosynthesis protein MviN/MurJ (putative lipid II flippase)
MYITLVPRMGIEGIGLSSSIAMVLQFIVVYGVWSVRNGNKEAIGTAGRLSATILVSAAGAAMTLGLRQYFYSVYAPEMNVILRSFLVGMSAGVPSLLFVWATLEITGILSMRKTLATVIRRKKATKEP